MQIEEIWLLENQAYNMPDYLIHARPNYDLLKTAAPALAGITLAGSRGLIATTSDEKSLLSRLMASWKNIMNEDMFSGR